MGLVYEIQVPKIIIKITLQHKWTIILLLMSNDDANILVAYHVIPIKTKSGLSANETLG